jgi:hypothetical protein
MEIFPLFIIFKDFLYCVHALVFCQNPVQMFDPKHHAGEVGLGFRGIFLGLKSFQILASGKWPSSQEAPQLYFGRQAEHLC